MKKTNLNELTLTEKISQLLMVNQLALNMKKEDGKESVRSMEEIKEIMEKYQYGSLWGRGNTILKNVNLAEKSKTKIDTATNRAWIKAVQEVVRLPMLVGMDCENGAGAIFSDATKISGPLSIGAADDEELTYELGAAVAREMKAAGANWRWTPVVDITNRFNGVSAGRTFSDDVDNIVRQACATIKGMESQKVATTVKHFPGMDPYEIRDGHIVPMSINISLKEWWDNQAQTFQRVIDGGVDSVMVGHIAFPAADDTMLNGKYLPATLSEKIIKGILREKMGFDGVVITDGIGMASVTTVCPYEEVLIRAINAGNDILLGVNPEDHEIIYKAVLDGRIPMERIDEAAERVLKLKEKIGLFDEDTEEIDMKEQAVKTAAIDRKIAEKSITLICDRNEMLPISKEQIKNVTIVCSSHHSETETELEVMKAAFEERGARTTIITDVANQEIAKELSEQNDLIVYAAYLAPHRPMGMPSLYGSKMGIFCNAFSYGKEKSVGVSMGYPYVHIDAMAGGDTLFNIYATNPESMKAFVKVLYGELEPCTKSPVDIEPKLRYVYG